MVMVREELSTPLGLVLQPWLEVSGRGHIPSRNSHPLSVLQQGLRGVGWGGATHVIVFSPGRWATSHPPCAPRQDFERVTSSSQFGPHIGKLGHLLGHPLGPAWRSLCESLVGPGEGSDEGAHLES